MHLINWTQKLELMLVIQYSRRFTTLGFTPLGICAAEFVVFEGLIALFWIFY